MAKKVAVRTARTRSYKNLEELGVEHICLDDIYEKSRSFSTLNKNLAKAVVELGDGTVYCVDGAASEDNSVRALKASARQNRDRGRRFAGECARPCGGV
ncbi:MAG: hypothetical protein ACLS4Z_01595 [Christensenellaceae bacterium]